MNDKKEKVNMWKVLTLKQQITLTILILVIAITGSVIYGHIVSLLTPQFGNEYLFIQILLGAIIISIPVYLMFRHYENIAKH